MAAATGKFVKTLNNIKALGSDLVAVDGSDGIVFDCKNYPNERIMFIIENTHASTAKDATLKKPVTGGYAAADADFKLEDIAAGAIAVCFVETAKYADNSGKVTFTGESTDIKVAGVILG